MIEKNTLSEGQELVRLVAVLLSHQPNEEITITWEEFKRVLATYTAIDRSYDKDTNSVTYKLFKSPTGDIINA